MEAFYLNHQCNNNWPLVAGITFFLYLRDLSASTLGLDHLNLNLESNSISW